MRAALIPIIFGGAPHIRFAGAALTDTASVDDAAGTASISGKATGTASWSLTDDASGKYAIDSSTGAVTVADTLTAGTDVIIVAVSGLTPAVAAKSVSISVSASAVSTAGQPIGLLLTLTKAA